MNEQNYTSNSRKLLDALCFAMGKRDYDAVRELYEQEPLVTCEFLLGYLHGQDLFANAAEAKAQADAQAKIDALENLLQPMRVNEAKLAQEIMFLRHALHLAAADCDKEIAKRRLGTKEYPSDAERTRLVDIWGQGLFEHKEAISKEAAKE